MNTHPLAAPLRKKQPIRHAVTLAAALLGSSLMAQAERTSIDVWDSTDPDNFVLVGTIQTILTPQNGNQHYDLFSASGHPDCVNLAPRNANIWMHESTNPANPGLTFGFIFSQDNGSIPFTTSSLKFRIVDSDTDPFVSISDDRGEAVESPPGSNAFLGTYRYGDNTDGIAVSGVSGSGWTIIIDSIDFGLITDWYAAGGGITDGIQCLEDLADLTLVLGHEYRLTPAGHPPSGAPVDPLPVANAGVDFAVNEGQSVTLDGHLSSADAELTYSWTQIGGTPVTLDTPTAPYASFQAPVVQVGGETLSFELTVSAGNLSDSDTVDINVINVNHAPVADAGDDLSIAEGSPVTLDGSDSFDVDNDPISYSWVQIEGPTVLLDDPYSASPSFVAPTGGGGGAPGIVATLVFELEVDDGFPPQAPADGYTLDDVRDRVVVDITNVNNDPTADAGADQTLNENSSVLIDGSASSDPDSDALTYAWVQIDGPTVTLTDASSATLGFIAPFVLSGGADLEFALLVNDGYGGTNIDSVVIHVQNINDPPLVSAAAPTVACLWPPNHGLVAVGIAGVSDPDDNATITIDRVTQDEATDGLGDGDTPIDAIVNADGTVLLRAERSGKGNGRVYHIHFTASDLEGGASGVVSVCVPHNKKSGAVDDGELFNSAE